MGILAYNAAFGLNLTGTQVFAYDTVFVRRANSIIKVIPIRRWARDYIGPDGGVQVHPIEGDMERQNLAKSGAERIKEAAESVVLPEVSAGISATPMAVPVDARQVVVVGNIDPRQHHPYWYRQIDVITDDELALGLKTLVAVVPPPTPGASQASFVQFDVGAFTIIVVPDKWTIQTIVEANRSRMLDVVSLVFDKKLYELPISAFGINRNWTVKLESITASQFLGDKLLETDLALPRGNAGGQLSFTNHSAEFDTNYTLLPSPENEKWLHIAYNRHHPIQKGTGKPHYFKLGDLIKDKAELDWQSAVQYGLDLKDCVERAERKENGN
ncbi:MAG TPA: hypothetical protein VHY37_13105 [Tepidisphaeraceae bacterium]|nr:hypothetical protein [Tepidisphaeraceae bacterium]